MTDNILRSNIERSVEVHGQLMAACLPSMIAAADALIRAYRNGHKAIFFGNGGSSTDAEHLAGEFLGRYLRERKPMPAVALSENMSALTAIANDYGFEHVYSRQLEALAVSGDVAVAISTSGNSGNVMEAVRKARELGLFTIGLTGASGGQLRGLVDSINRRAVRRNAANPGVPHPHRPRLVRRRRASHRHFAGHREGFRADKALALLSPCVF